MRRAFPIVLSPSHPYPACHTCAHLDTDVCEFCADADQYELDEDAARALAEQAQEAA